MSLGSFLLGGPPPQAQGLTIDPARAQVVTPQAPVPQAQPQVPVPAVQAPAGGNPLTGAWKNFITKVQTDDNFRKALFQTGVGLMQSPQLGQNNWDVAGNALNRGMMTLEQLRERDRQAQKEQRQEGREDKKLDAYIGVTGAQVRESDQRVQEGKARGMREQEKHDYDKTQRERNERMADAVLDTELAKAGSYRASAARDRAAAEKYGREGTDADPNRRKTNLEYAVDILTEDYISQGYTPEQAKVKAVREYNSKKTSIMEEWNSYRKTAADIQGINLLRMDQKQLAEWEEKLRAEFLDMKEKEAKFGQAEAVTQAREAASHVGRQVNMKMGDKDVPVQVIKQEGEKLVIQLPNGETRKVSANRFEQEYGIGK